MDRDEWLANVSLMFACGEIEESMCPMCGEKFNAGEHCEACGVDTTDPLSEGEE